MSKRSANLSDLHAKVEQIAIGYVADVKANGLETPFYHDAVHRQKSVELFTTWVAELLADAPDLAVCQTVGQTVANWNSFQVAGLSLLIKHLFLLGRLVPQVDDETLADCAGAVGLGYSQQVHQMMANQQMTLAETIQHQQQKLQERRQRAQKRFDELLEASFTPIVLHENGTITNINHAVTQQFGYQPADLEGKHIFEMIPPQEQPRILDYVQQGYEDAYETTILKRDKTAVSVNVIAKMIPFNAKRLRMVFLQPIEPNLSPTVSAVAAEQLTQQEQAVVQLVANGLTNQQIADELHLSLHTVKFHLSNVYKKLEINGRVELTSWWLQHHTPQFPPKP